MTVTPAEAVDAASRFGDPVLQFRPRTYSESVSRRTAG